MTERFIKGQENAVVLDFSRDGRQLLIRKDEKDEQEKKTPVSTIWDISPGQEPLQISTKNTRSGALLNGRRIYWKGDELWSEDTLIDTFVDDMAYGFACTDEEEWIAAYGVFKICLYNVQTLKKVGELKRRDESGSCAVGFMNSSGKVAFPLRNIVYSWDFRAPRQKRQKFWTVPKYTKLRSVYYTKSYVLMHTQHRDPYRGNDLFVLDQEGNTKQVIKDVFNVRGAIYDDYLACQLMIYCLHLLIYDLNTGCVVYDLDLPSENENCRCVSRDGRTVAFIRDGDVVIADLFPYPMLLDTVLAFYPLDLPPYVVLEIFLYRHAFSVDCPIKVVERWAYQRAINCILRVFSSLKEKKEKGAEEKKKRTSQ